MGQLQEVETYLLDGDLDALQRAIDKLEASTDFDALYDVAGLLSEYGFIQEADRLYGILRVHLPDEAQLKIDRAGTLLELGEEDEALLLLSDVKPDDEEYVQALLALADFYQMTGMAEAAIGKIKEAHSLVPHEPIIRFAYAELLLDAGKYAEAARFYLDLLQETDEMGVSALPPGSLKPIAQELPMKKRFPIMRNCLNRRRLRIFYSARRLPITRPGRRNGPYVC